MAEQDSRDIPLSLNTGWFINPDAADYEIPYCKENPSFALVNMRRSKTSSSTGWERNVTFACRLYSDLSRTFIKLNWHESNPLGTVTAKQKHFSPPTPAGQADLLHYSQMYGPSIVKFCEDAYASGHKVGDGECWTLANTALESIKVVPKCMESHSLIHGQAIFTREGTLCTSGDIATVQAGDIIQYLRAKFNETEDDKLVRIVTNGNPNHTSVIVAVKGAGIWEIVEQGTSLSKIEKKVIKIDEMVEGKLIVYRVVPETWMGSLVPEWKPEWG